MVGHFLIVLAFAYHATRDQILTSHEIPTLAEVYCRLSRLSICGASLESQTSGMAVSYGRGRGAPSHGRRQSHGFAGRGKAQCPHYKKIRYLEENPDHSSFVRKTEGYCYDYVCGWYYLVE